MRSTRMNSKYQIKEKKIKRNKLDEPYDLDQYSCKNVLKIFDVPEGGDWNEIADGIDVFS